MSVNKKEAKGNFEHRKEAQGRGEDASVSSQRTYRTGITRSPATSQERAPRTVSEAGAKGARKGLESMTTNEEEATELVAPLAGWRGWSTHRGCELSSFTMPTQWALIGENRAACAGSLSAHSSCEPPDLRCGCGYYSYRSWEHMQKHGPQGLSIHGVVALGGKVIQHEYGFRSQYAEVIAFLDTSDSRRLRSTWEAMHGKPMEFPVPLLSMAECEMLAIEQGCVWEPDVPEALMPEIEQYLVVRRTSRQDLISWESDMIKSVRNQSLVWDLVFAPADKPPVVGEEYSRVIRLPRETLEWPNTWTLWQPNDSCAAMQSVTLKARYFPTTQYKYLKMWTLADDEYLKMWTLADDDCRLDRALDEAISLYGRDWLSRFSEEGIGT